MSVNEMQKVYRLLRIAREQGAIPWEWIVDETRELERVPTWSDSAEYARVVAKSYRRDFWISSRIASRSGPRRAPYAAC